MAILTCQARVEAMRQLTADVRELTFRLQEPSTLPFTAGQYIGFRVPAAGKDKPVSRLYSINSAPCEAGLVQLLYNYVGGPGTEFLQGLTVGSAVAFKGPYGAFTLKEASTRDVLFVGTGTGLAPFRSMLREYLPRGLQRRVTLLWGVRHEADVYYQEEFAALEQTYPNFRFLLTLSRAADGWQGLRGRVTQIFPEFFSNVENLEVYCCGSDAMIHDITALCKARGECPVYREKYF
ncbi:MAG: hypothetical protein HY696_11665 [Deltaproteobacteria bacterium]|nr:hypothetical protein [Deltaproteobacteria bacterium]